MGAKLKTIARIVVLLLVVGLGHGPAAGSTVWDASESNAVCAHYNNSSTIRRCEVYATSATGSMGFDLEIASPNDGADPGTGGGDAFASVSSSYTLATAVRRLDVRIEVLVEEASASHTGERTNSLLGKLFRGRGGSATAQATAFASSTCGVRPNYCYARDTTRIVSTYLLEPSHRQDETIVFEFSLTHHSEEFIPAGEIQIGVYIFGDMSLNSAHSRDNGVVAVKADVVAQSLTVQEIL